MAQTIDYSKRVWNSGDEFAFEPLTEEIRDTAIQYLAGELEPAEPRFASSVMIVRDDNPARPGEIEVFMLKRAATMAFMPNAVVFPGGRVDEKDGIDGLPWAGPSKEEWAQLMGCDAATAQLLVVAAAREVFEECGVLLAGHDSTSVVENLDDPIWHEERKLLETYQVSFAEVLHKHNLVLRSDLLAVKSNWLTPESEPKRYDTYFFAALLPHGQMPDGDTSEAVNSRWVTPDEIYDEAAAGESFVLPPTLYQLSLVRNASSAQKFATSNRSIDKIMMAPRYAEDGTLVMSTILP